MGFVLAAALTVAAFAVLHLGRLAVRRLETVAPRWEMLVGDVFAVSFTALCGSGAILFALGLTSGVTPVKLAAFAASLAAAIAGVKLVAIAARRLEAGPLPPPGAVPH